MATATVATDDRKLWLKSRRRLRRTRWACGLLALVGAVMLSGHWWVAPLLETIVHLSPPPPSSPQPPRSPPDPVPSQPPPSPPPFPPSPPMPPPFPPRVTPLAPPPSPPCRDTSAPTGYTTSGLPCNCDCLGRLNACSHPLYGRDIQVQCPETCGGCGNHDPFAPATPPSPPSQPQPSTPPPLAVRSPLKVVRPQQLLTALLALGALCLVGGLTGAFCLPTMRRACRQCGCDGQRPVGHDADDEDAITNDEPLPAIAAAHSDYDTAIAAPANRSGTPPRPQLQCGCGPAASVAGFAEDGMAPTPSAVNGISLDGPAPSGPKPPKCGAHRLRTRERPRDASDGCMGIALEVRAKSDPIVVRAVRGPSLSPAYGLALSPRAFRGRPTHQHTYTRAHTSTQERRHARPAPDTHTPSYPYPSPPPPPLPFPAPALGVGAGGGRSRTGESACRQRLWQRPLAAGADRLRLAHLEVGG